MAVASLNRVDPEVHFDFGTGSPIPEQNALKDIAKSWQRAPVLLGPTVVLSADSPRSFRVNWQGSLLAPETGEYEFLVKTENATRFWVNDKTRPLIDALVKSGNDTEYRGSVYLLGGRVYPITAGAIAGQGKNRIDRPRVETARRAFEVIPRRNLSPSSVPETFVLQTPFPPDDRSVGYERGTSVSKAWDQATTDAAIEVAGYVVDSSQGTGRRRGQTPRPRAEASRILPPIRRARVPPAADRRAKGVLHRPPVQGSQESGDGRQARGAAGPQVAAVPLPRDRQRQARRL